jgi:integrase
LRHRDIPVLPLEVTLLDSSTPAGQAELALKPRLLDHVRDCLRRRHYSLRTEKVYIGWIRRFVLFHWKRHPQELGPVEVTAFLSYLARESRVAASTQNQALSALLFLYRYVLNAPLPWLDEVERARRPARLPTVLTVAEVQAVLGAIAPSHRLPAALLYGSGLRVMEGLALRVKDVSFERRQVIVRDGKGSRDRVTVLPDALAAALGRQLERVRQLHERDLQTG